MSRHGVLSGGAVARIAASPIEMLTITDSIAATEAVRLAHNVRQLSIAPLLAEAMRRISTESLLAVAAPSSINRMRPRPHALSRSCRETLLLPECCSLAIHVILEEIGKPYELERVDLARPTQYGRRLPTLNPKSKVPAAVARRRHDCSPNCPAIAWYLARTNPKAELLPAGHRG